MNSLNFHKVKTGKATKIQKHRRLRKIVNLLRYVEMCVLLVLVSRVSFQQLPVALKISSEYLRGFTVSTRFVFLVGNIIIITLFAQSGHFSPHDSSATATGSEHDLYLEFLQNSTVNQKRVSIKEEQRTKRKANGCMIKHPEKQSTKSGNGTELAEKQSMRTKTVSEEVKDCRRCQSEFMRLRIREDKSTKGHRKIDGCMIKHPETQSTKTDDGTELAEKQSTKINTGSEEVKDYRRCQSEIVRVVQDEKPRHVLQRCESESGDISKRSIEGGGGGAEKQRVGRSTGSSYPEDGMSNDEFRRTVEAFIARQQRLRKRELQALCCEIL